MKLKYFGHASFFVILKNDTTALFDPFGDIGYTMPNVNADIVCISHNHYDHDNLSVASGFKKVVTDGDFNSDGVEIKSIKSFHDECNGKKRGDNFIHYLKSSGLTLVHMGDFGEDPNTYDFTPLTGVDVLLIPVGGKYTVDAKTAKRICDIINPKLIIPMHFKTEKSTVDISSVESFTSLFLPEQVEFFKSDTVDLSSYMLSNEKKVLVLNHTEI